MSPQYAHWLQVGYWIALGALVLGISAKGTRPMLRTILAIFVVGLASLVLADWLHWPSEQYALAMIVVDALGGAIVLMRPAGKAQKMIGITYLLQCAVHTARVLRGETADIGTYWGWLSALAILQLVIAGGWWIHDRVSRRDPVLRRRPAPAAAHLESGKG